MTGGGLEAERSKGSHKTTVRVRTERHAASGGGAPDACPTDAQAARTSAMPRLAQGETTLHPVNSPSRRRR